MVDTDRKQKILVADDEDALVRLIQRALSDRFEVLTASNGRLAAEILENHPDVAAVIADHRMPGMTGVELLATALTSHPFAVRVLCTASENMGDLSEAVNRARVHRFFTKPIRLVDLRSGLDGALEQARLERENRTLLVELESKNRALAEALREIRSAERRLEAEVDKRTAQLRETNAELERLALRDPLTGLYNRRYLEEALYTEVARGARYQLEVSLVFLDVDHFKAYNDTHGHPAGDALLIQLGEVLRVGGRASDVAARYGGEEFVLVLPQTSADGAKILADRVRERVEQSAFPLQHSQPGGNLTVSVGYATFPQDARNAAELLEAADRGLLKAKRYGRNCVVRGSLTQDSGPLRSPLKP